MGLTRLHCHFSIEERREENIHSVVWYWTPARASTSPHFEDKSETISFIIHCLEDICVTF
jgi:hypothetical protein